MSPSMLRPSSRNDTCLVCGFLNRSTRSMRRSNTTSQLTILPRPQYLHSRPQLHADTSTDSARVPLPTSVVGVRSGSSQISQHTAIAWRLFVRPKALVAALLGTPAGTCGKDKGAVTV